MAFNWKSIPGFFSYEDFYIAVVRWIKPGETFVEIGSLLGRSIARAAVEKKALNKKFRMVSIDQGALEKKIRRHKNYTKHVITTGHLIDNLHRLKLLPHVVHIVGDSAESAFYFRDNEVSFVYIDACHRYKAVKRDIQAWLPKIKVGGIISGHDYNGDKFPGVKQAVNEIFGFEPFVTEYKGGIWAVVKEFQDGQVRYVPLRERPDFLKT